MKQLVDGQQLRIHIPNENAEGLVRHECCGCKIKHNIYIGRLGKDVTLAFVRVAEGKEFQSTPSRGGRRVIPAQGGGGRFGFGVEQPRHDAEVQGTPFMPVFWQICDAP